MEDPSIVVLDYGSRNFKGGFAYSFPTDDEPRIVTPTAVYVNQSGVQQAASSQDIHYPVRKGEIQNFDELEALIHSCLYDGLGWQLGAEGNIVVSEPLFTPKAHREQLAQLMFEVFNVSGLFFQDQSVLSLYAVGKVTGSVVDIGHGKLDVSTVLDGQLNASSSRRLPFGGEELTKVLSDLLKDKGAHATCNFEALKEQCSHAADSALEFDRMSRSAAGSSSSIPSSSTDPKPGEPKAYKLPDGQEVVVTTEGHHVAEALFRPELLNIESPGLAETLMDSVQTQYEGNYRRPALENILVCGGGSSIPNIAQRLLNEVRALTHPSLQPALCPIPEYLPQNTCKYAPWVGGAVLGKVLLSQTQFITKWDYEEAGPNAVHRRCS